MSPATKSIDPVGQSAVELARAAAVDEAVEAALVGEHLRVISVDERIVDHRFAYAGKAYRGWEWSVELARVPRGKTATVNDVVLLPGADALLPPEHVPWVSRVTPGDLGVGDVLPTPEGDPRLVLRIQEAGSLPEPLTDRDILHEQGAGRSRALSPHGRLETAERWYASTHGPRTPIAEAAPASCQSCGFHVRLVGALGAVFGVCTNVMSPDDGTVVSVDHGCGAHSEVVGSPEHVWESPVEIAEYDRIDPSETIPVESVVSVESVIPVEIAAAEEPVED